MAQQQPAPLPRSGRDDADSYGRLWYELGPRQSARRVLESPVFLEWVRRPVNPSGRGGGILEPGNTDVTRTERQLLFSAEDAWRFESGARYRPMLISEAAIPTEIYAALMYVHDQTAGHAYGPGWRTRVRGISIQITQMDSGDDRGDHNDSEKQGEFIASYTAQGSCDIRLCYATAEPKPADAPHSARPPYPPQMVRGQSAGCYYSMRGPSLAKGIYHGVRAHAEGRLSVTFRFVSIAAE